MATRKWFDRKHTFGYSPDMLPFFLERLEGTLPRIRYKIHGVDDRLLSEPFEGKWSAKQHIGHLAEVDKMANLRVGEMISGAPVLSPAVFEPANYSSWPIEKVLQFFEDQRALNLNKYRSLSVSQCTMSSQHPRLQMPMTPVDLAWFDAEHDDHHLLKISEIISTLKKN